MFKKIFFIVVCCLLFATSAQAASLEMRLVLLDAGGFKIEIYLSPSGEVLNAVEGRISIPTDFKVKEVRSSDSIVSFWLEKPEFKNGEVMFGGVMPGGFEGVLNPYKTEAGPGKLFEIFFSEKPSKEREIKLVNSRVFLNDGLGTSKELKEVILEVSGNSLLGLPIIKELRDILPPEEFLPLISRDLNIFNNQWFLSFTAIDKQSGVSNYYVYESNKREELVPEKKWQSAESPYLLHDQSLESFVFVRAVDGVGNERIVILEPSGLSSYPTWWRWIIIILVGLGASVLVFLRLTKRK
jgi:hypothetical protein